MFDGFLEACVGSTDAELDAPLRASELAIRKLTAERPAPMAVIEHRGSFRDDHRSMAADLRARSNVAPATTARDRKLARLHSEHPAVGDAWWAGHIAIDHALQIARIHAAPHTRHLLGVVVGVFVDAAEHTSPRDGGRPDQHNAHVTCGHHNRTTHRQRTRTRRNPHSRPHTLEPDGTIIHPIGEHPPDPTTDQPNDIIRTRLAALGNRASVPT